MTQVSLSTSTNYSGEQNALIEEQQTALTVNFELDEPAPSGGLKVFVDSNVPQIVNRLDLPGFAFNPTVENINPALFGTSFDNSGFYLTIDEGATTASFTINVFDNPEPDTFLPETFDGLVEAEFSLIAPDGVEQEDLGDVGNLGDYTINPDAASSTIIFADEESQLTDTPEPPTEPPKNPEPPASGLPLVSLNTGPDYLVEEDGTVSAHVFNITGGTIPEDGLLVSVSAPNLSEFDLDGINVSEGGEIVNVREDGFDIRLTDFTVLVNLPVAADGETEDLETASFTLDVGDGYEVNSDFSSGEFTLVDTREEVPDNFSDPNDIIPLASNIKLSTDNPQVTVSGQIDFEIGNRYQNDDGSFTYVDGSEDIDFYKLELKAGDVISSDADGDGGFIQNIFDAEGNILEYNQLRPGGIDETFQNVFNSYVEFEAPEDGTYYLGVSTFFNGLSNRQVLAPEWTEFAYDPFSPASGTAFYPDAPQYELNIALNPDTLLELPELNRSNNNPPDALDLAEPGEPVVSLNVVDVTFAPFTDEIVSRNLVENTPFTGGYLGFVLETEGEIPSEGIIVTVNSDIYLRDYFGTFGGLVGTPFTPGAEFLGPVTDDTGLETGFQLRILEPNTFVGFGANRNEYFDGAVEPETDGPEDATFFLEGGEGYGVDSDANQFTVTYYDSEEQAPEISVIPEVSLSITETELIESEGTETVLNFSLSEPAPEEGVVVYVTSPQEGALPQFEVLEAEVTGGVYPIPDGDITGFYFKITEPVASITLPVFEDPFDEGLQGYSLALQENPFYTIAPEAGEVNYTIADTPDSIPQVSLTSVAGVSVEEGATSTLVFETDENFPSSEVPEVTVTVEGSNLSEFDPDDFIINGGEITEVTDTSFSFVPIRFSTTTVDLPVQLEGEVSVDNEAFSVSEVANNVLTFNLTAQPASEGVTVTVDASNLSEFDADAITVTGGEIIEITDVGFSLKITDITATVELPPAPDGDLEGMETATFSLVETTNSTIDPEANEATFTLYDNANQVPVTEEFKENDTIPEAIALNLNPENLANTITGSLAVTDGAEGRENANDTSEDVDIYAVELQAGDTVKIDVDSIPFELPAFEGIEQRLDSELRLFDVDGNELASVNNVAAPDEELGRDPYLEFTAESAATYYIGVSNLGNNDYDPFVQESGGGWVFPEVGVFPGEYELNVSLTSGDGGSKPTTETVFGSLEGDTIEVSGTSQLIFGGDSDDLIDASISTKASNRIYAGSGDDTVILGSSDRIIGGAGDDKFFATSGGNNTITGGEGADQFWIATAEIPEAANTITDFTSGEDVLGIAGLGIGFEDLTITQQDDNTLISANGSDLAILQGVDSLMADNFAFA